MPRVSGASPAIVVPPDDEPPALPPIRPDSASDLVYPSIAHDAGAPWSSDPRSTVPGPAPAPRAPSSIDASPSTEPMAAVSPSASGATSTIPGVGVGDARRRTGSETDTFGAARPAWLSTRNLAIGGGAIAVLIFAIVLATRGGHDKVSAKDTTTAKLDSNKTGNGSTAVGGGNNGDTTEGTSEQAGEQVAKSATGTGVRSNSGEEVATAGSDSTTETPPVETPTETGSGTTTTAAAAVTTTPRAKTGRRPASSGSTLGGKQVVLEYDSQARDTKTAAPANVGKGDQSAITKARTAYSAGNQRLFAGDPEGAIKFYRQALGYYPAYVAGYRGLGLAYAQQGNKAQAVQAFKTYVSSVPTAKDAALIRKRITSLQH